MSTKAKGCVKLRRCQKLKPYYKAQFVATDRNRDKRMLRHLRGNPNDVQTAKRYGLDEVTRHSIELNSKGRQLHRRYEWEAAKASGVS